MREPEGISQTLRFPDNEKPRLRRKCRGNRGGKPGGLLDRELRDRRVAEPLVIDLRVGAVLIDLAETIVDLGEQFRVALADSDTEVLFLEIRVARHVEVLAGVLLRIVREDTDVTDRGVDAARVQLFKRERGVVETLDVGARLAESLRADDVARGVRDNSDFLPLQVIDRLHAEVTLREDQLMRGEVREREIHRLLALREAANLVYLAKDAQKQGEMEAMAGVIAASFGVPAAMPVVKMALAVCWAFAESILDLREMLDGGKVALFKTAESWQLSLEQLPKLLETGDQSRKNAPGGMEYSDYLRLLLMQKSGKAVTFGAMDLVEYNMRTEQQQPGFRLDCCVDELEVGFTAVIGKREYEITRNYGYEMQGAA